MVLVASLATAMCDEDPAAVTHCVFAEVEGAFITYQSSTCCFSQVFCSLLCLLPCRDTLQVHKVDTAVAYKQSCVEEDV